MSSWLCSSRDFELQLREDIYCCACLAMELAPAATATVTNRMKSRLRFTQREEERNQLFRGPWKV